MGQGQRSIFATSDLNAAGKVSMGSVEVLAQPTAAVSAAKGAEATPGHRNNLSDINTILERTRSFSMQHITDVDRQD